MGKSAEEPSVKQEAYYQIHAELLVTQERLLPSTYWPRRLAALNEALSWKKGKDQDSVVLTELYRCKGYALGVAKHGKKADPSYTGLKNYITGEHAINENDMLPVILKDGVPHEKKWTFQDMFGSIERLMHKDTFALEVLGTLLFRAAFMLDHVQMKDGTWRYAPPRIAIELLEQRLPLIEVMPVQVYLHFLEILSLNEDVKVHTLGYHNFRGRKNQKVPYGRINTLLTFAHLIAVFLGRESISKIAGAFARPPSGMAPLGKKKAFEVYPLLRPIEN